MTGEKLPEATGNVSARTRRLINEAKLPTSSITANRPTMPVGGLVGYMHFDTTVGKPIWWQGTKWVYADGTDA